MIDQYFTPTWAAELIVRRYFADLGPGDTVLEPACGDGRFLLAVPDDIDAFGVEIDPAMALTAIENTGREVITGDFRFVRLPRRPTVVIGNPPFEAKLIEEFLSRCYEELDYGGRVGFLLPVYIFQTAATVMRFARHWSLAQELVPRNLFERLQKPLMFARFTKEKRTVLAGLFLYAETAALEGLRSEYRRLFVGNQSRANVWRETLYAALAICGGQATLQQLYQCIENNRPTENQFWREKIRQTAAKFSIRVREGEFRLPDEYLLECV